MYKSSFYNFFIPIEKHKVALMYNSLFGGLFEFQENEGYYISDLIKQNTFNLVDIPFQYRQIVDKLIEANYFISSDVNEIEIYQKNYEVNRKNNIENGRFAITITPTLACNLACRYCFQNGAKARVLTDEVMDNISRFIEDRIIEQGGVSAPHKTFHLTWFGGEPLLAANKLVSFTNKVYNVCRKYDFEYSADMVTNGTLLTDNNWNVLKESRISRIQVTLDGPAETHNLRRLSKSNVTNNYEQILTNLEKLPIDIHLAIRINCDKIVWKHIDGLLNDLEAHGIWPQKAKQINISLAFITSHDNARFEDKDWHFNIREFFGIEKEFIDVKLRHYNEWALSNGLRPAKKRFRLPTTAFDECYSAVNQNGFVIDSDGNIHKCWEDVDKPETSISNVSEPYNLKLGKLVKWLEYNKTTNEKCLNCKFLPICATHCTKKMLEDKRNQICVNWKYNLEEDLKQQYIEKIENPQLYSDFCEL